jgi:hypothetical protein
MRAYNSVVYPDILPVWFCNLLHPESSIQNSIRLLTDFYAHNRKDNNFTVY